MRKKRRFAYNDIHKVPKSRSRVREEDMGPEILAAATLNDNMGQSAYLLATITTSTRVSPGESTTTLVIIPNAPRRHRPRGIKATLREESVTLRPVRSLARSRQ
jgi:hypothetical protein